MDTTPQLHYCLLASRSTSAFARRRCLNHDSESNSAALAVTAQVLIPAVRVRNPWPSTQPCLLSSVLATTFYNYDTDINIPSLFKSFLAVDLRDIRPPHWDAPRPAQCSRAIHQEPARQRRPRVHLRPGGVGVGRFEAGEGGLAFSNLHCSPPFLTLQMRKSSCHSGTPCIDVQPEQSGRTGHRELNCVHCSLGPVVLASGKYVRVRKKEEEEGLTGLPQSSFLCLIKSCLVKLWVIVANMNVQRILDLSNFLVTLFAVKGNNLVKNYGIDNVCAVVLCKFAWKTPGSKF